MTEAGPYPTPRYLPSGDAAMTVEFGNAVAAEINERVLALDAAMAAAAIPGVVETIPTYRSLFVQYDPVAVDFDALRTQIEALDTGRRTAAIGRRWTFPVCYGGIHGIDLDDVAHRHDLPVEAAIAIHLAGEYRVYMIGFTPGFAYLGGLDPRLHTPRHPTPRLRIPANSVGLGGVQAGITSIPVPSGWHLLGRTPARMFDLRRNDPFLLRPGDRVRFERIDAAAFDRLDREAEEGNIVATCQE